MPHTPVQKFLELYLRKIATYPDRIVIKCEQGKRLNYILYIEAAEEDVGKIIGKNGKMISSLKNFISAVKAKNNTSYELIVVPQPL